MSGKPDAPLRQIEPERKPHRPAQPGIGIALRRPHAFDQAAEYDAVVLGETRFERPEDAHAQIRLQRTPYDPAGKGCGKQFDIIRFFDRQIGGGFTRCQFVERIRELCTVATGKRDGAAVFER